MATYPLGSLPLSRLDMGSDAALRIESLGAGDRDDAISELDDIHELVKLHQARIRRFATYSTGDPDLAESITQDTLLRAYRGRDKFRGDCSVAPGSRASRSM